MEEKLLLDVVIIFAFSTVVNFIFSRIKIPTAVGYLITGIIAGPHLLSLVKATHDIELIAEIGVVLLLFGIGLEFSLKHLLRIRKIVFFGGFLQVSLTVSAFYLTSYFYDLDWKAGLFIGFLAALSSSALVLKILQERSELTSNYGRTVLGILIFQDLLLVPLLLFTNLLGQDSGNIQYEIFILILKAILIISMVFIGNRWVFPKVLHFIAMTKNQELFMMSIFLICLAIALFTWKLGMSLAFGAFLAGLMISESEYSHNAFGNIITLKDIFSSFFFVSIGMLLDISFVYENIQLVLISILLVLVVKTMVAGGTGFLLGHTFRGTVMVGLALSQVGEFSFILAKIGNGYNIISSFYYQLFLAVAVITMALTPFLMNFSFPLATRLLRLPLPPFLINGLFPLKEVEIPVFKNHLVIIGKDASALKLSKMANLNNTKHVSIVFDPGIVKDKIAAGDMVIYGDAVNEPILMKAHIDMADIVVLSIGDLIPTMAIIEKIRKLNKKIYIIARSKQTQNIELLYKLGADQVIPEKLEIAIDIYNRILIKRLYTQKEISSILTRARSLALGKMNDMDVINKPNLINDFPNMNINAVKIEPYACAVGKSLAELQLRTKTGVTLLAIGRDAKVIEHLEPSIVFNGDDIVYLLGNPEQINLASELFT
ncbi:MAG: cation:proton antiporter [Bacteroidales bacterium]|nr:cation:proton antiporter [Bacteroidales bacterium]